MAATQSEIELREIVRELTLRLGHRTLLGGKVVVTTNGDATLARAFTLLGWPSHYTVPR